MAGKPQGKPKGKISYKTSGTGKRPNRDLLTGGKKYTENRAKKHLVEEVKFDPESRQEYLTGFHKRKLERQKKAQEYHKEQERLAKIEERKQIKLEKEKEMLEGLKRYKEALRDINGSDYESDNSGAEDDEEKEEIIEVHEDEEWDGIPDVKPQGILKRKIGEDEVIIEDLSNGKIEEIASLNFVNLKKSEQILEESIDRAKKYAVAGAKKEKKQTKKKFRYLTKAERRANNRKAKDNKRRGYSKDK